MREKRPRASRKSGASDAAPRRNAGRLPGIADAFGVPVGELFDGAPGGDGHVDGASSVEFLAEMQTLRLVRAFDRIEDRDLRRMLVAAMEAVAARSPPRLRGEIGETRSVEPGEGPWPKRARRGGSPSPDPPPLRSGGSTSPASGRGDAGRR